MPRGKQSPEIGDQMDDGTILAGYSDGKALYVTPQDASGTFSFDEAARYAKNLKTGGHRDFRVPTAGELAVIWENRNKNKLKQTFKETISDAAGWYWSSSPFGGSHKWAQCFVDGDRYYRDRRHYLSLRCVR